MVELLRKAVGDLLMERNKLSSTEDLQGQAPIQCEKCVTASLPREEWATPQKESKLQVSPLCVSGHTATR